jgi:hypothetical protein
MFSPPLLYFNVFLSFEEGESQRLRGLEAKSSTMAEHSRTAVS